ncbi:MAG TPA: tRNA (adenine-N1)-methyltransferase [Thermoplasmata archaeon]
MSPADPIQEGETVLLRRGEADSLLVRVARGPQSVEGRGVLDLTSEIGRSPGGSFAWAGANYRLLRPSLSDLLTHLRRKAQIIIPKDAQQLLYLAGVGPGARVIEAGSGSGALTTVLAHAVGPTGRVYSYDRRADFLEVARRNVASSGFSPRVDFRARDVATDGFDETEVDSVLLDLPEPWAATAAARTALKVGGYLAVYIPTYNQVEEAVRAMRRERFEEVRALELMERALHVGEGGTRPEFEMLGHTGFLAAGRRVD